MDFSKIWGLVKPIIIFGLAVVGFIFAANKFDGYLFTAIGGLSILFRGAAIWSGLGEVKRAIFPPKETQTKAKQKRN